MADAPPATTTHSSSRENAKTEPFQTYRHVRSWRIEQRRPKMLIALRWRGPTRASLRPAFRSLKHSIATVCNLSIQRLTRSSSPVMHLNHKSSSRKSIVISNSPVKCTTKAYVWIIDILSYQQQHWLVRVRLPLHRCATFFADLSHQ